MVTSVPATVFNAARVSQSTISFNHVGPDNAALVENNYVEGEVLTGGQEHVGAIAAAAGAIVAGPYAGVAMGLHEQYEIGTPVGSQRSLPAVGKNGNPVNYFQANAVDRHSMDYVLNGLEQQVKDDDAEVQVFSGGTGVGAGY